jgi:phosphoglycolate phosphatase
MKKKVLFYDLDGTIVDTRRDITAAANHMVRSMGGKPLSPKQIGSFVGQGLHYLIQGCLQTDDAKRLEKGGKIYRQYYAAHMLDHTVLYAGVAETLEYFQDRTQAVITNKPDPFSQEILRQLGVAGYFSAIITGNSTYPRKPDPAAIISILKTYRAKPEEALLIGDSAIDIQTARNAGIEVGVMAHGFTPATELKKAGADYFWQDFHHFLKEAKEKQW